MPEGDTLYNLAAAMRPHLVGCPVIRLWTRTRGDEPAFRGRVVHAVEARGKHLLVTLDGGWVLRTHLGLKGIWHRYRRGEPWRRSRALASVALETERDTFVCFRGSAVALVREAHAEAGPALARLGPDLLDDGCDLDAVVRRARAPSLGRRAIADTLLDQAVAAGIGNVFKSEALHVEGVYPWTPTSDVDDATLRALYATARALLRRNRRPGPRVTTPDALRRRDPRAPRLFVYGRTRRPCLRCRTPIRARRQGAQARVTYWCPRCQPAEPAAL